MHRDFDLLVRFIANAVQHDPSISINAKHNPARSRTDITVNNVEFSIEYTPDLRRLFSHLIPPRDRPIAVNGSELKPDPDLEPPAHFIVTPTGDFSTGLSHQYSNRSNTHTSLVSFPHCRLILPNASSAAGNPHLPEPTIRGRVPNHTASNGKVTLYDEVRFNPSYRLEQADFERLTYRMQQGKATVNLDDTAAAELQRQAEAQFAAFCQEHGIDQFETLAPNAYIAEQQLYTANPTHDCYYGDPQPGIRPVQPDRRLESHLAEYSSLMRAINMAADLPYLAIYQPAQTHNGAPALPKVKLNLITFIDADGKYHERELQTADFFDHPLPEIQPQEIVYFATVQYPDGRLDEIEVPSDLCVVNSYYATDALITPDFQQDSQQLQGIIFDAVWDYNADHRDYNDDEILQHCGVLAVRLREGHHQAFVSQLQNLADDFRPYGPMPRHPVTVQSGPHRITWEPNVPQR